MDLGIIVEIIKEVGAIGLLAVVLWWEKRRTLAEQLELKETLLRYLDSNSKVIEDVSRLSASNTEINQQMREVFGDIVKIRAALRVAFETTHPQAASILDMNGSSKKES